MSWRFQLQSLLCAVAVGALAVARNILAAITSKFFFPIIMDLFVNTILC